MKYSLPLVPTSIKRGSIYHKFKISNHSTVFQCIKIFDTFDQMNSLYSCEWYSSRVKKQLSGQSDSNKIEGTDKKRK